MSNAICGKRAVSASLTAGLAIVGTSALISAPMAPSVPDLNISVPQIAFTDIQLTATPVETVVNFITGGLTGLADQARGLLITAGDAFTNTFLAPVDEVTALLEGFGNPFTSALADLVQGARDAATAVPDFWFNLVDNAHDSFIATVNSAGSALILALDAPAQAINALAGGVADAVTTILGGDIQGGLQSLVNGLSTGLSTLGSALSEAATEIVGLGQTLTANLISIGQSLYDGFVSIPQHLAEGVANALAEFGLGGGGSGALRVSNAAAAVTGTPADALPSGAPTVSLSVPDELSSDRQADKVGADASASGVSGPSAHARPDHRRPSAQASAGSKTDKAPAREGGTGRSARGHH